MVEEGAVIGRVVLIPAPGVEVPRPRGVDAGRRRRARALPRQGRHRAPAGGGPADGRHADHLQRGEHGRRDGRGRSALAHRSQHSQGQVVDGEVLRGLGRLHRRGLLAVPAVGAVFGFLHAVSEDVEGVEGDPETGEDDPEEDEGLVLVHGGRNGAAKMRCLDNYMQSEKPYLNPELTIKDISDHLNISRHHITQVLNEKKKKKPQ